MATRTTIQRHDAIPLYHQIFLGLRDDILSGRRAHGAVLPTEHELAASFGVSRITARRALGELALHKLVERRPRVGTRVAFRAPTLPIEADINQTVESLIAFGRNTQVRVVDYCEEPAAAPLAAILQLAEGAPLVRALRLRSLDGEALGAIESHVPTRWAGNMTREALTRTPLLELLRSAGHVIGGGHQTVSAIPADPALASLLGTEPRAAIISIERLVAAADGTPLALTTARYRGDRYRLSLDLHHGASR